MGLHNVLSTLDELSTSDPSAVHAARRVLELASVETEEIADTIEGMTAGWYESLTKRCHETPTHFKWFLGESRQSRFTLWVHEYKESEGHGGWAESIHDHRYGFTSMILSGGFTQEFYSAVPVLVDSHARFEITQTGERQETSGTMYECVPATIHRLSDVAPGTTTLLVKAPASKPFSTSFDSTGSYKRHYPFIERRHDLISMLRDPATSNGFALPR